MESTDPSGPRGSGVLRHTPRERTWEPAGAGDPNTAAALDRHVERHFGPVSFVWHEMVSDLVHLDVYMVEPTPERRTAPSSRQA